MGERRYSVYIMASRSGNLYIGMTGNIEVRAVQHKTKHFAGFTADYNCNRLVWYESYDDPNRAIDREKQIKRWIRSKKLALIDKMNPTWIDRSEDRGKPLRPMLSVACKNASMQEGRGFLRRSACAQPTRRDLSTSPAPEYALFPRSVEILSSPRRPSRK